MNLRCKKRGIARLQSFIIYLILASIVFLSLMFFINNMSSGKYIEEQILAKQIALLIDSAKPGTQLILHTGDFVVEKSGNKIKVKSRGDITSYVYEFFSPHKVSSPEVKEDIIILRIS